MMKGLYTVKIRPREARVLVNWLDCIMDIEDSEAEKQGEEVCAGCRSEAFRLRRRLMVVAGKIDEYDASNPFHGSHVH